MALYCPRNGAKALAFSALAVTAVSGTSAAHAAAGDYRFELAGKPQMSAGKDVVQVRLVHVPDGKPALDAVIIHTVADMSPGGMATMTAPVTPLTSLQPGIYRFEVVPSAAGTWALTLAAKVQGETETVHGSVIVEFAK